MMGRWLRSLAVSRHRYRVSGLVALTAALYLGLVAVLVVRTWAGHATPYSVRVISTVGVVVMLLAIPWPLVIGGGQGPVPRRGSPLRPVVVAGLAVAGVLVVAGAASALGAARGGEAWACSGPGYCDHHPGVTSGEERLMAGIVLSLVWPGLVVATADARAGVSRRRSPRRPWG